uniref:Uncharacterized protein n=1 Tax=Cyanothece sp. (strain PCC 7425 / ATCC 29141) TaxID=395961 RepID=B8HYY6_CYAP4
MKLDELKSKAYALSGTSNVRQLKDKYEDIRALDMRRKSSWEAAIVIIEKHQQEFQDWLANPPDEYKELFAEIDGVTKAYSEKVSEIEEISSELLAIGDELEAMAEDYEDQADQLIENLQLTRQVARQAELN